MAVIDQLFYPNLANLAAESWYATTDKPYMTKGPANHAGDHKALQEPFTRLGN